MNFSAAASRAPDAAAQHMRPCLMILGVAPKLEAVPGRLFF